MPKRHKRVDCTPRKSRGGSQGALLSTAADHEHDAPRSPDLRQPPPAPQYPEYDSRTALSKHGGSRERPTEDALALRVIAWLDVFHHLSTWCTSGFRTPFLLLCTLGRRLGSSSRRKIIAAAAHAHTHSGRLLYPADRRTNVLAHRCTGARPMRSRSSRRRRQPRWNGDTHGCGRSNVWGR